MLKSLVTGLPVRELDALMVAVDEPAVSAISLRPLPAPRRWWQLAPGVTIPHRQKDSFTSLNLLLNSPYQWVLDYAARLRPSAVLAVSDGALLYGNLAHRLVERFYRDPAALTMSEASFNQWLDAALPTVLAEEGAVLLMPGRRADLERFQARVRDALAELRVQLARAGVVQAIPEMSLSGSYAGGEIRGLADLVVVKPENRRAILDMKWGGKNRYPDMLAENRHLQLAIYAELLQQQTKAWPAVAYFLLEPARLVVRTNEFFPGAQPEFSQLTETTAQVWQRFLVSWRWRMDQIEAGCIELVVDGIEPAAESKPPDAGLAVETLALAYSDFANLVGWGAES
jgi:RecB family exonuclease